MDRIFRSLLNIFAVTVVLWNREITQETMGCSASHCNWCYESVAAEYEHNLQFLCRVCICTCLSLLDTYIGTHMPPEICNGRMFVDCLLSWWTIWYPSLCENWNANMPTMKRRHGDEENSSQRRIRFVKVKIVLHKILELPRRTDEYLSHLQFNLPKYVLRANYVRKWKTKWNK